MGGWGLRLMSGFMQQDLPFTLARVDVHAIASACLWWFRLALWWLRLIADLVTVFVCADALWCSGLGVTVCTGCWMERQIPATESARDVMARRAWVSSPLELRFRDFLLSLVLSLSVSLRDRLPPPFRPTSSNVRWMGPCAVAVGVGSLSPSGCPW